MAGRGAERRVERAEDRGEAAVAIVEDADARALELRLQVGLRAVDDDQIRPQRQDALDVGIEQRADACGSVFTSGGKSS